MMSPPFSDLHGHLGISSAERSEIVCGGDPKFPASPTRDQYTEAQ